MQQKKKKTTILFSRFDKRFYSFSICDFTLRKVKPKSLVETRRCCLFELPKQTEFAPNFTNYVVIRKRRETVIISLFTCFMEALRDIVQTFILIKNILTCYHRKADANTRTL